MLPFATFDSTIVSPETVAFKANATAAKRDHHLNASISKTITRISSRLIHIIIFHKLPIAPPVGCYVIVYI